MFNDQKTHITHIFISIKADFLNIKYYMPILLKTLTSAMANNLSNNI